MCESPFIDQESNSLSYEDKLLNINAISKPMASKKTTSRIYRLIEKAAEKKKTNLRIGMKAVQSKIKKGERGVVVMAGDIAPLDVICHMPAVCEEKDIPYIFVPSKMDLGASTGAKGSAQIVLIIKDSDYGELYDKVHKNIKKTGIEDS